MNELKHRRRGLALVLALSAALAVPVAALAQDDGELAPSRAQAKVLEQSLDVLEHAHYHPRALDDGFAEQTLERYLTALDPNRLAFLQSDVDELTAAYGRTLDDSLRDLDLGPAFAVFERYLERRTALLDYLEERAKSDPAKLVLDGDETLARDRSEAPWPRDLAEARDLWERVYRNDVLTARIAGSSPEDIRTSLEHRYAGQRRQLERIHSDDVFAVFLDVVAGEFDPHTNYLPPVRAEDFEMSMALSFDGIGAVLGWDGECARVESIVPGGPAERSGELHPMDRIVAVGQGSEGPLTDVVGWRTDEVVRLIRGPRGSTVRLQVRADGAESGIRTIVLERDHVTLEGQAASSQVLDVSREGVNWRVGVIRLPAFYMDFEAARSGAPDYRSSTRDVGRLLDEMRGEDVDAVVVDLRANGGGALNEAQGLAGLFLGERPVVQVRDAAGRVQVLGAPTRAAYVGPLVVLVDRLSASASEILAAAIQDWGRGVIVGSRTFGKGTVQGVVPLESGQMTVTQAKFYRVSGGSTQNRGVEPDVLLPETYDASEIGESALPQALAFDRIRPVIPPPDGALERALPTLRKRHVERAQSDPELVTAAERLSAVREYQARPELSLNESVRRAQREAFETRLLAIENQRRGAEGLEPLKELATDQQGEQPDVDLQEAARVAADLAAWRGTLVDRGRPAPHADSDGARDV